MGAEYKGDFLKGQIVRHFWNTFSAAGGSITRAVNGTISIYEDGGLTQFTAGVIDTEDFDGITGVHRLTIDTSQVDYEPGKDYTAVLTGCTVDGQTVNAALCSFSVENRALTKYRNRANGSAQGGSLSTLVVAAGSIPNNNFFQYNLVWNLTTNEWRVITSTVAATDLLNVYPNWHTLPQAGDSYVIVGGPPFVVVDSPEVDANGFVTIGAVLTEQLTANAAANFKKFLDSHGNPLDVGIGDLNSNLTAVKADAEDVQSRLPAGLISGRISATLDAINDNAAAAQAMALAASTVTIGAVAGATQTTAAMTTNLTEATDGHYIGKTIVFTSGALKDQINSVQDYDGATKLITFSGPTTEAPAIGDGFALL